MYGDTGRDWLGSPIRKKEKGPEGLVFKTKQVKIVERVASGESSISGIGADTTGVNDPPNDQNDKKTVI